MTFLDIFILALALSVDASVVSFSYGLITKNNRAKTALKLASATAAGQTIMPIVGWLGTSSVGSYIEQFDHWISFLVFAALGINIIRNALKEKKEEKLDKRLKKRVLFAIAIATSIDAMAAGVTLYFEKTPIIIAALTIGIVCFINSLLSFKSCYLCKKMSIRNIEIMSGLILIALGFKVLFEHLRV